MRKVFEVENDELLAKHLAAKGFNCRAEYSTNGMNSIYVFDWTSEIETEVGRYLDEG